MPTRQLKHSASVAILGIPVQGAGDVLPGVGVQFVRRYAELGTRIALLRTPCRIRRCLRSRLSTFRLERRLASAFSSIRASNFLSGGGVKLLREIVPQPPNFPGNVFGQWQYGIVGYEQVFPGDGLETHSAPTLQGIVQ